MHFIYYYYYYCYSCASLSDCQYAAGWLTTGPPVFTRPLAPCLGTTAPVLLTSTAPCEIPDGRGDSFGYQGLLPPGACRVPWPKLFHILWINYQPRGWYRLRSKVSYVLFLLSQRRSHSLTCRCVCAGSAVCEAPSWLDINVLSRAYTNVGYCVCSVLHTHTHTRGKLLLSVWLSVCACVFVFSEEHALSCVAYLCERKTLELHVNVFKLRSDSDLHTPGQVHCIRFIFHPLLVILSVPALIGFITPVWNS